jgi:hypothetical protein
VKECVCMCVCVCVRVRVRVLNLGPLLCGLVAGRGAGGGALCARLGPPFTLHQYRNAALPLLGGGPTTGGARCG